MGRIAGIITEVEAGWVRVACRESAQSACIACARGGGCGWQRPSPNRLLKLEAGAGSPLLEPGDAVEVEVDDSRLLLAACRLYLPPLIGLLAGPLLLRVVGLEQGVAPLLAAASGLGLGGLLARHWTRTGVPVHWLATTGSGDESGQP